MDWTTRPIKSIGKFGAIPPRMVPTVKIPMALKNSCRVEKRSIKKAVTGIMTPLTSINTVVSHWAEFADTFISSMIGGIAVIISVWFNMVINDPASSKAAIRTRLGVCSDTFLPPF